MWNFSRKPCLVLLILVTLSQLLGLWNYAVDKHKVTDKTDKREPMFLVKHLLLESEDSSNNNAVHGPTDTERMQRSSSDMAGDNVTGLEIPPHTYIEREHKERGEIGIDTALLMSPPRDVLNFTPPRYLPDYRNPCFPINYDELLRYYKGKNSSNQIFTDMDTASDANRTAVLCLPSFYLVGWPKCGTTELTKYIQHHQSVYRGIYEVHFWNRDLSPLRYDVRHYFQLNLLQFATQIRIKALNNTQPSSYTGLLSYGTINFPEEHDNNILYGKHRLIGDYTPTYAYGFEPQVPHKIRHVTPNAKIIFSLRDPAERMLSHINYIFKFNTGQKFEASYNGSALAMSQRIHEIAIQSIADYNECLGVYCENYCATKMSDREDMFASTPEAAVHMTLIISLYHISIAKYMELFPDENILIIDLGEFSKNHTYLLNNEIFPFLGLGPYNKDTRIDEKKANTNTNPLVEFLPETHRLLREFYKQPQQKLQKLLNGRSFSWFSEYGIL